MADDAYPPEGAHDPDRDMVVRLIDQARPRATIVPPSVDEVEAALRRVLARRDRHDSLDAAVVPLHGSRPEVRRRVLLAAAALLVAVGGGLLWTSAAPRTAGVGSVQPAPRQLVTRAGQVARYMLPDSTRVVLGPQSTLTVADGYGAPGAPRAVTLRGDAYFHVVHRTTEPFVVHTAYADLTDLGTAFSVRDAGALGVQVSVAEGRVAARGGGGAPADTVTLGPTDRALVQPDGRIRLEPGTGTADDHTWTQGRLVFRDAPIEYVAAELRRWYGLDLRIADSTFRSRRLTATFDRAAASDVGPVIAAALGGVARQTGDTLYVTPIAGGGRRR